MNLSDSDTLIKSVVQYTSVFIIAQKYINAKTNFF